LTSSRERKIHIYQSIVATIRSQTPKGRFLERDHLTGVWYDIGDRRAGEKTSQALREGAPRYRQTMMMPVKSPPKKDQAKNKTATPGKIRRNDIDTSDDDDGRKMPAASKASVEENGRCSSSPMRKEDSSASHTKQTDISKGDHNNISGAAAASAGAARKSVFGAAGQQHNAVVTNTKPFETHVCSPASLPSLPFPQTQVSGAFRTAVLSSDTLQMAQASTNTQVGNNSNRSAGATNREDEGSRLQHYAQLSQHDLAQRLIGMERENASMKFRLLAIGFSRQREVSELNRLHALELQSNMEPTRIGAVAQNHQQPQTAVSSGAASKSPSLEDALRMQIISAPAGSHTPPVNTSNQEAEGSQQDQRRPFMD
jgi:hypothetical protein